MFQKNSQPQLYQTRKIDFLVSITDSQGLPILRELLVGEYFFSKCKLIVIIFSFLFCRNNCTYISSVVEKIYRKKNFFPKNLNVYMVSKRIQPQKERDFFFSAASNQEEGKKIFGEGKLFFFFCVSSSSTLTFTFMATSGQITLDVSTKPTVIVPPQIVVHQDNTTFSIGITLDGTNYSLWSREYWCLK